MSSGEVQSNFKWQNLKDKDSAKKISKCSLCHTKLRSSGPYGDKLCVFHPVLLSHSEDQNNLVISEKKMSCRVNPYNLSILFFTQDFNYDHELCCLSKTDSHMLQLLAQQNIS